MVWQMNNMKPTELKVLLDDADEFIEPYLEDITRQTIFKDKCELILINANSPGNEEPIIKKPIVIHNSSNKSNISIKSIDNNIFEDIFYYYYQK